MLAVLECSGPALQLELHGPTAAASNSRDLLETCDETAVKSERILEIDPLKRLALDVAQLAVVVDARNRAVGTTCQTPSAPALPAPAPRPDNVAPREELGVL